MVEAPVIGVDIKPHKGVWLKVVWNEGTIPWDPYYIDRGVVRTITDDIRRALAELVRDAMSNSSRFSSQLLKEVANEGRRLYRALFRREFGEQDPAEVQQWLEARSERDRIMFRVEDRIHVPWGLIYDRDPAALPETGPGTNAGPYEDFWCLKYQLSTVYFLVRPRGLGRPFPSDDLLMLPVVNRRVFDRTSGCLRGPEQIVLGRIRAFKDPVYRSSDLFRRWQESRDDIGLLYFYCHANGERIELAPDDEITVQRLKEELDPKSGRAGKPVCIVFLNGCATASGAPDGGFLEATGSRGFCGFIGTETKVPDVFAMRFGLAFLHDFLYRGQTVVEVMDYLRRRHWPLGLIYGTYCYPLLHVQLPEEREPPEDHFVENLSCADLGTEQLDAIMIRT